VCGVATSGPANGCREERTEASPQHGGGGRFSIGWFLRRKGEQTIFSRRTFPVDVYVDRRGPTALEAVDALTEGLPVAGGGPRAPGHFPVEGARAALLPWRPQGRGNGQRSVEERKGPEDLPPSWGAGRPDERLGDPQAPRPRVGGQVERLQKG